MSEDSLREKASLGARYKEHLADYNEALDAIEAQYAAEWAQTFDAAERDNLWRAVQVIRKMKQHFGQLASAGTLASHQLTELRRLNK